MYSVAYRTKKGGSAIMTTNNFKEFETRVKWLFRQRIPATLYKDGQVIGRVWEDNSQRNGWNYSIESNSQNNNLHPFMHDVNGNIREYGKTCLAEDNQTIKN